VEGKVYAIQEFPNIALLNVLLKATFPIAVEYNGFTPRRCVTAFVSYIAHRLVDIDNTVAIIVCLKCSGFFCLLAMLAM